MTCPIVAPFDWVTLRTLMRTLAVMSRCCRGRLQNVREHKNEARIPYEITATMAAWTKPSRTGSRRVRHPACNLLMVVTFLGFVVDCSFAFQVPPVHPTRRPRRGVGSGAYLKPYRDTHTSKTTFLALSTREPPPTREPAGVESLFTLRRKRGGSVIYKQDTSEKASVRQHTSKRWRPWQRRKRKSAFRSQHIYVDHEEQLQESLRDLDLPPWACSSVEEERRVAATKLLLKDDLLALEGQMINLNGVERQVTDAFPDVYGDLRILRFLRKDQTQNPVSAATRFRIFLQWRRDNNVDAVRVQVEKAPFSPPPHLQLVAEYIPCDFDLYDSHCTDDTVPALLHVSDWDTAGVTRLLRQGKLTLNDFLQYWTYMYESLHLKLYKETIKRRQMVYIDEVCDLQHLHMRQLSPGFASKIIKPWIYLTQRNYPETAKHIIFLNPPKILSLAWTMVAPFVSPSTLEKICMRHGFQGNCHDYIQNDKRDEAKLHHYK